MSDSLEDDKEALADQLRDFADRVEDGEIDILEIEAGTRGTPRVTLEGMNADDFERLYKNFE